MMATAFWVCLKVGDLVTQSWVTLKLVLLFDSTQLVLKVDFAVTVPYANPIVTSCHIVYHS